MKKKIIPRGQVGLQLYASAIKVPGGQHLCDKQSENFQNLSHPEPVLAVVDPWIHGSMDPWTVETCNKTCCTTELNSTSLDCFTMRPNIID